MRPGETCTSDLRMRSRRLPGWGAPRSCPFTGGRSRSGCTPGTSRRSDSLSSGRRPVCSCSCRASGKPSSPFGAEHPSPGGARPDGAGDRRDASGQRPRWCRSPFRGRSTERIKSRLHFLSTEALSSRVARAHKLKVKVAQAAHFAATGQVPSDAALMSKRCVFVQRARRLPRLSHYAIDVRTPVAYKVRCPSRFVIRPAANMLAHGAMERCGTGRSGHHPPTARDLRLTRARVQELR